MAEKKESKEGAHHSEHHEHHESHESHEHSHTNSKPKNPWMIVSVILAIAVLVLLVLYFKGGMGGEAAGKKIVTYLNERTGGGVEYVSYVDNGNLYEVTVSYQNQKIPVYITKDGKYFVQGAIPIDDSATNATDTPAQETPKDVPKSDKPKVELFVMTHCPYGTQAEKGFIPAMKELGSNVDAKIRFVHYFMHGDKEETETYNQICIREEMSSKYIDYLSCFLEDSDSARCLTKVGIDKLALDNCVKNKAKGYYKIDSDLSNKYGVEGSPTLVINGVQVSGGRSPDAMLKSMCSAFNKPASACSKTLSTANPSAGFGTAAAASGAASAAQCA